jgi:hypothetical protein
MAIITRVPQKVPTKLREVLQQDPAAMEASPMFTAALAYARAGFPVVPCMEGARKPHTVGSFMHGANSATADYERVRDHWYEYPDDNVAIASEGSFVLIDIDPRNGGSLEVAERTGLPVDGYRERTVSDGWRIPLVMPPRMIALRSFEPVRGVEVKARGSYAVAPHSRIDGRWYRPELDRDVWQFGAISERWEYLNRLTESTRTTSTIAITADDQRDARELADEMRLSSDYGDGISALLDGDPDWARYFPTAEEKI